MHVHIGLYRNNYIEKNLRFPGFSVLYFISFISVVLTSVAFLLAKGSLCNVSFKNSINGLRHKLYEVETGVCFLPSEVVA